MIAMFSLTGIVVDLYLIMHVCFYVVYLKWYFKIVLKEIIQFDLVELWGDKEYEFVSYYII